MGCQSELQLVAAGLLPTFRRAVIEFKEKKSGFSFRKEFVYIEQAMP